MNYSSLYNFDMVNGTGVRVSLFVSGCSHHCKGCFNKKTWNPSYGKPYTNETCDYIIKELQDTDKPRSGLSLLGGDPTFDDNISEILHLVKRVKNETSKNVWMWTGYTLPQMQDKPELAQLLEYVDVIIEGKFVQELKTSKLPFRGSSNQRLLRKGKDY